MAKNEGGKLADLVKQIEDANIRHKLAAEALQLARSAENRTSVELTNLRIEFTKASAELLDKHTLDHIGLTRKEAP